MEEIDLEYPERFKEVLPMFKQHSIATRKEIKKAHRFLDTMAAIKQQSNATQKEMEEFGRNTRRLSLETKNDVNEFVENFLFLIRIGYLKLP